MLCIDRHELFVPARVPRPMMTRRKASSRTGRPSNRKKDDVRGRSAGKPEDVWMENGMSASSSSSLLSTPQSKWRSTNSGFLEENRFFFRSGTVLGSSGCAWKHWEWFPGLHIESKYSGREIVCNEPDCWWTSANFTWWKICISTLSDSKSFSYFCSIMNELFNKKKEKINFSVGITHHLPKHYQQKIKYLPSGEMQMSALMVHNMGDGKTLIKEGRYHTISFPPVARIKLCFSWQPAIIEPNCL